MYRLIVITKSGTVSKHYFEDYDSLDYNATFCQFSSNISKAIGQQANVLEWKTLFTIG